MMNIGETNLVQLASKRLQWLSDRQAAISENIANADVTDYRAKDVESFDNYMSRARHAASAPRAELIKGDTSWGQDQSGNNVVLEEQVMQAGSTSSEYRVAASLYRKAHSMMLAVAGRR